MEHPLRIPPRVSPQYDDGGIPDWVYGELCDCLRAVCAALDGHFAEPDPALTEWRRWAAGFLAGLYYRKTAERAELTARNGLDEREHPVEKLLCAAAGDAARAVVLATNGDHAGAWARAVIVRALVRPPLA